MLDAERDGDVQTVDDVVRERTLQATARRLPRVVLVPTPAVEERVDRRLRVPTGDPVGHPREVAAGAHTPTGDRGGGVGEGHRLVPNTPAPPPARAQRR